MKQILLLAVFFSFHVIVSCQNKKQITNSTHDNNPNTINTKMKIDTLPDLDIKSMKAMLEKEYDNIDGDAPVSESHFNWLNSEILKALLKNGYKIPTSEEF